MIPLIIHAVDAPSDSVQVEREREEWEREQQRGGDRAESRSQRSVSRERWVETMVVADSKLIEYHGSDNVESYIFTIMNMVRSWKSSLCFTLYTRSQSFCTDDKFLKVFLRRQVAGIFHDASIGNAIHVILVRLILLQGEEVILS